MLINMNQIVVNALVAAIIFVPSFIILLRITVKTRTRGVLFLAVNTVCLILACLLQIIAQMLLSKTLMLLVIYSFLPSVFLLIMTWNLKIRAKLVSYVIMAVLATIVVITSLNPNAIVSAVSPSGQQFLQPGGSFSAGVAAYYFVFYICLIILGVTTFKGTKQVTHKTSRILFLIGTLVGGVISPVFNLTVMSFYDALSDAVGFLFLAVSLLKDPLLLTSPPSALPEGKGSSRPALTTPRPTITGTQAPVPSRKKDPIEQLKGIMKVTRRLEISRMAQLLEMSEEDLWKRIVPWAQEFGFTIDKNEVEFQTGQVDAFMQELEREFKSWGKRAKQD